MKLLLCTQNENKIKEIKEALKDFNIKLISLKDLNDNIDVKEKGKTFKENALLKARYYSNKHKMIALADDSGLEVVALNMAPGIYSSRYAKTDKKKINKLLKALKKKENKDAQFITTLVLYNPFTKEEKYFTGILKGKMTDQLKGKYGFGYDPVFYVPEFSQTLAEMSLEKKSKISHRGLAIKKLKEYLNENINNIRYS